MYTLRYILLDKYFLLLLFLVNFFGTIYGFIWYESQLKITPTIFLPFVPDSPTASMFFTIWLLFFMFRKNLSYIAALAVMSLFKYGTWAVVMNIFTLIVDGAIGWQGYLLIASHAGKIGRASCRERERLYETDAGPENEQYDHHRDE